MPIKLVNGINMYYEVHGEGEPLVLISGFGTDCMVWMPILANLLQGGFKVILIDNRGIGQTDDIDSAYSTELMAQDTAALLKELGITNAFVVGHSMGGLIAQQLAIHFPELVGRLVLYSTYAKMSPRALQLMEFSGEFFRLGASEVAIKYIMSISYSDGFLANEEVSKQVFNMIKSNPRPQSQISYMRQLDACRNHDTEKQLKDIKIPVLIVDGARDIISMNEEREVLVRGIPNAESRTFDGMAHFTHLELITEFVNILQDFLKQKVTDVKIKKRMREGEADEEKTVENKPADQSNAKFFKSDKVSSQSGFAEERPAIQRPVS